MSRNSPTNATDPTGTSLVSFANLVGRTVGQAAGAIANFGFSIAGRFASVAVSQPIVYLNEILITRGAQAAASSLTAAYIRGVVQGLFRGSVSSAPYREAIIAAIRGTAQSIGGRELVGIIVRLLGV